MPRCKYCKAKFEPRTFNWKTCSNEVCNEKFIQEKLDKAKKQVAKEIIETLQDKERIYTAKQRIELRNDINFLIGIYKTKFEHE